PKPLARFFNVRYACICRTPQRCVYVMPYGSNIDVARCGWDVRIGEQWHRDVSLTLNMTRFQCHCERAARARQSTSKESRASKNPDTVDCHESQ
ncbi:MAG: hypothetical protein K2N54_08250, partial [Helicobacter sp.]|nr:hypothetical protein [Helicobacter sp.]